MGIWNTLPNSQGLESFGFVIRMDLNPFGSELKKNSTSTRSGLKISEFSQLGYLHASHHSKMIRRKDLERFGS